MQRTPTKALLVLAGHALLAPTAAVSSVQVDGNITDVWGFWSRGPRVGGSVTLEGHGDAVLSVAVSADGAVVVTGSRDNTAKIWDGVSGALKHTLKGHSGVYGVAVAVSADGAVVVTGSSYPYHTAKIWDGVSGALKHTLKGHLHRVSGVAVSADGAVVVTGSWDANAKIWDGVYGALKHTLEGHSGNVNSVAVSADGAVVVTGSSDYTAMIWDGVSGALKHTLKHTFKSHLEIVNSVAVSADGAVVVTGTGFDPAKIWDSVSGTLKHTLEVLSDADPGNGVVNGVVGGVAVSADGAVVVTGSRDRTAKIWWPACGINAGAILEPSGACNIAGCCQCDPQLGVGPTCEFSNNRTCNGNGIAQIDGSCVCDDPEVGVGPTCTEFSNSLSCNGNGIAQIDGSCECLPGFVGADCAIDGQAREDDSYIAFYFVAGILVSLLVLVAVCVAVASNDAGGTAASRCLAPLIVLFRSFDMMSDWAFYAIPARKGGVFAEAYTARGKDFAAFRAASLTFCILGLLLWCLDLGGQALRIKGGSALKVAFIMLASVVFEDIPQLALQSIYFETMGFDAGGNAVALVAFIFSLLSLLLNISVAVGTLCTEGDPVSLDG